MKKRRILLALIMLIICGISLTTATYAWFTINRAVSVEQIDVSAQASGGIQISADAVNWSNVVDLDELQVDTLTDNYFPDQALMPVTTVGVNDGSGAFDFYLGELHDNGSDVQTTAIEDDDGYYVAFDLYFYSATAQTVYFNQGTQVIAKSTNDAGLKYSTRVGFLVQGTGESDPDTIVAANTGTTQLIWEPNADQHTERAVTVSGASGVVSYMGGMKETGEGSYTEQTNTTYFETVTKDDHNLLTSNEFSEGTTPGYPTDAIFEFEAGISKVRVYIWLEGQDVDNEDTASLGDGVSIKLNFKINEATN